MRAVNLLPPDQRRGGDGSGVGTHVLLGVLAAVVVGVAAYVVTVNSVSSRRSELSRVAARATSSEQRAASLRPYRDFAALRQARVQTVASLAASRFDWERVMNQLSRALPADVWLTGLVGTVAPGVTIDGASSTGDTGSLRSADPSPAVEIVGCTSSQSEVSRVMARLRLLTGVTHVSLSSSQKSDNSSGASSGGGSGSANAGTSTDCRNGQDRFPQFHLVVFFAGPPATSGAASPATPGGAK